MIFEFVDPTLQIEILLRTEFGSKGDVVFMFLKFAIYLEKK
jgi:hypothetical protein